VAWHKSANSTLGRAVDSCSSVSNIAGVFLGRACGSEANKSTDGRGRVGSGFWPYRLSGGRAGGAGVAAPGKLGGRQVRGAAREKCGRKSRVAVGRAG
jgi:hypothetical protein